MSTQWRKIIGDFRQHRLQIILIGLVLALGTAGVVAALNARAILRREIADSYRRANSPDIILWFDQVDARLLAKVRSRPGVAAVDARRTAFTRVEGKAGQWFPARLTVMRDFGAQSLGLVHQHQGEWPPGDRGFMFEQSGQSLLAAGAGGNVRLRTPGGAIVTLPVAGLVHDTAIAPSTQDRMVYLYATPATAERLGQNRELDQLLVKMQVPGDSDEVTQFAGELNDWLKANDEHPLRADALSNTHPHAMLMATMLKILQAFAGMAFACSAALAVYMVSLWMKREVRQVGIMKTIGARSSQLARQYLALVGPLVLLAGGLALPAGAQLGRWLVRYYEASLNIDVINWSVPSRLLLEEILLSLGIPFLAMAVPIVRAARMTAREAIQDPGITAPATASLWISRWIKMPGNRRWTLALRNTFRRPWRLGVTLIALSTGGALLLTAHNVYESLMRVVDVSLANQGHDLEVSLSRPVAAGRLESIARTVQDIEIAEAWRRVAVAMADARTGTVVKEGHRLLLSGYPASTRLLKLPLQEGRWPQPGEIDAVVANRLVQNAQPGLRVGGELEIHYRDHQTKVRVVGLVGEIGAPVIYAPFPSFEAMTGLGDSSSVLRIKIAGDQYELVANALDQALLADGLAPSLIQTRGEFRNALDEHFAVVCDVMKMVALAAALVGAISLGASISLNVLERAREIGVIRALGATPRAVVALFLAEGGAVAGLSALLGLAASLALSRAINGMASRELLHVAVPLQVSTTGLAVLCAGGLVVMLAVWLPVTRALGRSVREALAYE